MFFLFNKGVYPTYKHIHVYLSLNIGISCHSLTATMLAMNMSRLHLRSARNWSEMSGTHTHTLWQPHRHTHKSTSRWSPSVWAHCVFVWATKFNYLGTGQIYGSLEISLIGKVFSPPPLTHTHTSTGGAFPWVFPNFPVYAFFSSAFARLWWHYRNFDYSGISRALAGTHTAYTLT